MGTGKSLQEIQAQNDLIDWITSNLNVHDLNSVSVGIKAGVPFSQIIYAFKRYGAADSAIADEIEMVRQTYSSTATIPPGIGGKYDRQYQPAYFGGVDTYPINWQEPEQFIDVVTGAIRPYGFAGRPDVLIGSENTLEVPCSPDLIAAADSTLKAMRGKPPTQFWEPNPTNPYTFTPDMKWLDPPPSLANNLAAWSPDAIGAAFEYMMQGYDATIELLWGNPPPRDLGLLLGYGYEMLSRFYGVTTVGANLTAKCIATAKKYGIEYGMTHLVSSTPIDPDSLAYVKKFSSYYTPIPFPRMSEIACMLMLQGEPVFLPLGDPRGVPWEAPEGITGQPITGPMTVNVDFGNLLYRTATPARFAAFAALGGNKRNMFFYPTPDTMPDETITNPDGSSFVVPGGPTATQYGAPIMQWRNPDNSFALPLPQDNSAWNDLEASVNAGIFTEQQCFNLVDQGIRIDPAINDLLFVHPDPGVTAAWDASHKNAKYLRTLYLRLQGVS